MAGVRFTELQSRPMEFLDFTSVTLDEFQQLVPPFETAFQCHMAAWRMDGKPRTARRFPVYKTCPLPTPEDRLVFILTYVKTYALQVVQGRLFGMVQSKANRWIHVLLPALLAAPQPDAPRRPCAGRAAARAPPKPDLQSKTLDHDPERGLLGAPRQRGGSEEGAPPGGADVGPRSLGGVGVSLSPSDLQPRRL